MFPIRWVWKLQLDTKRKLRISMVFAVGLCACVSSIMRLHARVRWGKSLDQTYYLCLDGLWIWGEVTGGIVCACLPMANRCPSQLVLRIKARILSYKDSRKENSRWWDFSHTKHTRDETAPTRKKSYDSYIELTGGANTHGKPSRSWDSKESGSTMQAMPPVHFVAA